MPQQNDDISLSELVDKFRSFFQYLKTKWLTLLLAAILGAFSGLIYYYIQSPKFTAECTFVLDDKSSSGGGGLASLASSFGVDVGSMLSGGGSLFAYDNLIDILQSRRIIETVLLSEVDTAVVTHQTLADLYMEFTRLKKVYDSKPRTAGIHFSGYTRIDSLSPVQDSILYVIYKNFIKNNLSADRTNKKTQIFKVDVTSKSEYFSKLMTFRMVNETKNLYIGIKTGTTQKNIDRLQQKSDSLLLLLNGKSYESAETQVLNANPAIKSVAVPTKLALRNETIVATLYTDVVKNLEIAKTNLMLQTPIIQLLDIPRLPLENLKTRKLYCVAFSFFGALVLVFIFYSIRYFFKINNLAKVHEK